jgi:hypothetical protein
VWADNLGDNIDYHQQKRENLGDLIMETLEVSILSVAAISPEVLYRAPSHLVCIYIDYYH